LFSYLYFLFLVRPEIIVKTENIFDFNRKSSFSFRKLFLFLNFVNHFSSLSFSFSNRETTTESPFDHCQATPDDHWTTIGQPLDHHLANTVPLPDHLWAIPDHCRTTTETSLDHQQVFARPLPEVKLLG